MNNKISGIWENKYVCDMGILRHLHECVNLNECFERSKARKDGKHTKIQSTYENELMDLFLILEKRFENEPELKQKRLDKFMEKAITEDNEPVEEKVEDCTGDIISDFNVYNWVRYLQDVFGTTKKPVEEKEEKKEEKPVEKKENKSDLISFEFSDGKKYTISKKDFLRNYTLYFGNL